MLSSRLWTILNISLLGIIILLTLSLMEVELPTLGKARYLLDPTEPLCVVNWREEFTPWNDLNQCCLEARKQLECIPQTNPLVEGTTHWACQTGSGEVLRYLLNNKAYYYCQQQSVWR